MSKEGGIVPPHSVVAPGTALGSRARVALSSAQVNAIVTKARKVSKLQVDFPHGFIVDAMSGAIDEPAHPAMYSAW
jgi:hypothetical protein